jgi:hypothetical protein
MKKLSRLLNALLAVIRSWRMGRRSPPLSPTRAWGLTPHIQEGWAWLRKSDLGRRSTMLTYAAFELRLAVERLTLEYLKRAEGDQLRPEHLEALSLLRLRKIKKRIYELAGHQRIIDRKFRVFEIMFEMMDMPIRVATPNLNQLSKYWHRCSHFCHVGWSLRAASSQIDLGQAFESLIEIHGYLAQHSQQLIAWASFLDPNATQMQQKFVSGEITEEGVRAYFRKVGLWARVTRPDGKNEFVGKAVPPDGETTS